jgi:hypothetical protein
MNIFRAPLQFGEFRFQAYSNNKIGSMLWSGKNI